MVAIIETDEPGEGNRHVAGAHLVVASLYAVGAVVLVRVLFGIVDSSGFDDAAIGVSWTLAVVAFMAALHVAAAHGSRLRRSWARSLSRVLAFFLVLAFPLGTIVALLILRNTRPPRWSSTQLSC